MIYVIEVFDSEDVDSDGDSYVLIKKKLCYDKYEAIEFINKE